MKAKQIEQHLAAQTLVAATNHLSTDRLPLCKPASIQAMRQPRKVFSSRGWSSHNVSDGVIVQYEDGKTATLRPAEIVSTWEEYQERKNLVAKATIAKRSAEATLKARMEKAAFDLTALAHLGDYEVRVSYNQYGASSLTLTLKGAEAITELLKK